METKQRNALSRLMTPDEKLESYLEFGKTVMKYYRQIPDEQQLAMDAKVYLKANLTHESLTAAFECYLGLKDSLYPPKPGQLIALATSRDETVKPFLGFSDADKKAAEEAKDSPEYRSFNETLMRIMEGKKLEQVDANKRRAELRAQAERVSK